MKTPSYKETAKLFEELREIARKYEVLIIVEHARRPASTHVPGPASKLEEPIFVDYLSVFPLKTKI